MSGAHLVCQKEDRARLRNEACQHFLDGMSPPDISRWMGVPLKTIHYWIKDFRDVGALKRAREAEREAKRAQIIAAIEAGSSLAQAARDVGVSRTTAQRFISDWERRQDDEVDLLDMRRAKPPKPIDPILAFALSGAWR